MPEIHELGPDDFCRACSGSGSRNDETCLECNGKGHNIRFIKRHWLDHGLPSAVCVHEGEQIGYRIRTGPSEECGCPEEDWVVLSLTAQIHFEEDESGHVLIDAGDWDHEFTVPAPTTMDALRQAMFTYITGLHPE